MKDFYALFIHELKRIYNAEKQMAQALPSMIEAASQHKLKKAFEEDLEETKDQITRLEAIGRELNQDLYGYECEIMRALLREAHQEATADYDANTKDAALINSLQRAKHFEIATYGVLKAFAKHLKLEGILKVLEETSREEGHQNKKLTEIAEGGFFSSGINTKACKHKAA